MQCFQHLCHSITFTLLNLLPDCCMKKLGRFGPSKGKMLRKLEENLDLPPSTPPRNEPSTLLTPTIPPLFKPLIPFIKLQLCLCNYLVTIPFEWDEDKNRVRLLKSKKHLRLCKAQITIHVAYTLLMMGHFLSPENQKTTKNATRMVG